MVEALHLVKSDPDLDLKELQEIVAQLDTVEYLEPSPNDLEYYDLTFSIDLYSVQPWLRELLVYLGRNRSYLTFLGREKTRQIMELALHEQDALMEQ